jgi:hypothetical protein
VLIRPQSVTDMRHQKSIFLTILGLVLKSRTEVMESRLWKRTSSRGARKYYIRESICECQDGTTGLDGFLHPENRTTLARIGRPSFGREGGKRVLYFVEAFSWIAEGIRVHFPPTYMSSLLNTLATSPINSRLIRPSCPAMRQQAPCSQTLHTLSILSALK